MYDQLGRLIAVVDFHGDTVRYLYDAAGNLLSIQRYASSHISIISFSPDSGPVGTTVTISGTGFSSIASQNVVKFHGVAASVARATVTQLVAVVPAGATSGQIDVSVPDDSAKSSAPFTVAADSGSPTIASFTPTMGGVGTAISLTGTGFDATALNNRVSLNASVMNVASAATTTLATSVPGQTMGGRIQVATARGSTVSASDFYVLPAPFTPADVIVADRMTIGSARTVSIAISGKVALVLFDGMVGQRVSIRLSNSTITLTHATIYRPDGLVLYASGAISSAGLLVEPQTLPVTGSYTVLIDPDFTYSGSVTLSAYSIVDVTGSIVADGAGVPISIAAPGQNARLNFDGMAGQVITAQVTDGTFSSYCFGLSLSIVKSDGTTVGTSNSCSGSSALLDQLTLPTTGTYTLFLNPDAAQTGNAILRLHAVVDVTGPLTLGTAVPVPITTPGQNARLTFGGVAGQVVSARVANGTFSSYCFVFSLSIVGPDGATLGTSNSCSGSSGFLEQLRLPVTGRYTLVFNPDSIQIGNATLTLYGVVDVTGPITAGTGVSVSITTPGQNARLTFSGTAGQFVAARVANGTFSSYCFDFTLSILKPDGTTLGTINSCSGSITFLDQLTLPVTGTYTLFFNPDTTQIGNATISLYIVVDVTGSMTVNGAGVLVPISTPGQNARLTFSGKAGQVVTARVANGTFASYCFDFSLSIVKSDGTTVATSNSCSGSSAVLSQKILPTTGVYSVVFNPDTSQTGTATLTLTSP